MSTVPSTTKARHNNIFSETPLKPTVMRASYQDSNIFSTTRSTQETVQKTAGAEVKDIAVRNTNTYKSGVFVGERTTDVKQRG
jgi:hypothetical protein